MSNQYIDTNKLKNFYDGVYTEGDIRDNEKLYIWIMRLFSPKKGKKFLDVACGGGHLLKEAEKFDLQTYGLDISDKAVELAAKNASHSKITSGNGENLPWPDAYFDYLSCLGSIEHYMNPDKGIKEINRVLTSEGIAIIILPNLYQFGEILKVLFTGRSSGQWQILEQLLTREGWKKFLEENGLKVIKILKYNKYPEFFQRGTFKVKSIRKFITVTLIRYLAPFNLAQQFVYICKKKILIN